MASAAAAKKVLKLAPVRKAPSVTEFGSVPIGHKPFAREKNSRLPIIPTRLKLHEFVPSRYENHYYDTVRDDVMYMNYIHERGPRPPPREIRLKWDPNDPYSKYRKNPSVGGDAQVLRRPPPPDTPENVTRLEKIQIHTMHKQAIGNKQELVGVIMALRALSGETERGGGHHAVEGVQVVRGKRSVGGWIRPNVPCGAKVEMKGQPMWDFMGSLVDFVLPRLREFEGVGLPYAGANPHKQSNISGVVSFGLPREAMQFFPQIEVNVDSYPKQYGMHIHFVTNAEGVGAQDRARALLSGFQIPFTRKQRS
ncbi:mitochondrial 50S ribosomal protein L5 [Cylindrobasidium torrendii FP15055 ss-10]|uniref:Mitochondrial 50S ribosomal protein L5 n=1 Tax=Cylindrobasidium torrendii FP15055 ss-10 TaxID=1314674 RepID=A0A0D7BGM3_9AGAR|nr:mitochondrial 50S ribosomal protein L5 [Cylindrobasidium torrendii FP15055 ss-10]